MHADLTIALARQRVVELARDAELARRRGGVRPGRTLRVRAGTILLRWGAWLAPSAPVPGRRAMMHQ